MNLSMKYLLKLVHLLLRKSEVEKRIKATDRPSEERTETVIPTQPPLQGFGSIFIPSDTKYFF